jgi:predicted nucleic-acid-binding Zn-ribbon protein
MIRCAKCDNDTRTSGLVTAAGEVLLAGTIGSDPQPIVAQVCTACGYIELYAPQPLSRSETVAQSKELSAAETTASTPIPAA